jgi:hypothetical protein
VKIDTALAILDVKRGRKALNRAVAGGGARIPVTIHGFIVGSWSVDDGTSREFEVEVTSAVVGELNPPARPR